jgi:putative serine/threonine protein kinase
MNTDFTFKNTYLEKFEKVICYPKFNPKKTSERFLEIKKLGIREIFSEGKFSIQKINVLGKGYCGIVVLASTKKSKVALKIRRTDIRKKGIIHEVKMQKIANSENIGPKLLDFTENIIMMEVIEGISFIKWINYYKSGKISKRRVLKVLRDILEQCRRLDARGLDHGELSDASKHILITSNDKVKLLDFEKSSTNRKVSNVTSICHYLFMSGKIANLRFEKNNKNEMKKRTSLITKLGIYKRKPSRVTFLRILKICLNQLRDI